MTRTRWMLVCAALALVTGGAAQAQDYSFSVPEMRFEVTPNADASVTLHYTMKLHCNGGGHPIDIVDVGLPDRNYNIANMSAWLNGAPLSTIRPSEYIDVGVEVPLSPPIQPNQTGTFEFEATMPNRVYQDTTNSELASLRITPTWFDGNYLTGTTDLMIVVYLPDSVNLDDVVYQLDQPFDRKIQLEGRKAVAWVFPDTRVSHEHMVGVSFPRGWMDHVVKQTALDLAWKWWTESGTARVTVGIVLLIAFSVWYFRLTGGTGTCLFIPLVIALPVVWSLPKPVGPALELLAIPVLIILWLLGDRLVASRKRSYLPPIESVPGGEIKRGLTAPEAAVLLERPLGQVLALVIFGMLKKGLVRMIRDEPLTVEVPEHFRATRGQRREVAAKLGTVIRGYEQPFLDAIMERPGVPIPDLDLSKEMRNLVNQLAERMAGFDLERSREYYQSIVAEAWSEARQIGDVERRDEYVDNNIGWLMLDEGYPRHFHTWHRTGYHYSPGWARPAGQAPTVPAPAPGDRTSFGDVAASFAGWSENVAGRMASTMDPVSVGLVDSQVMDLSGVDRVGMDFLEAMAESSRSSGGGGGGGCACACAGCACACACAGGGR
ncbi:MAG: hypothetical protein ACP5KN_17095 [Armatimonadota bacterium]